MAANLPRVLVVDDCQNTRNALKRLFRLSPFEFSIATSGQDGLVALQNEGPFNTVVADYLMPQMDGVAFLKQVNRLRPETFCILLTAYPECHNIGRALQQGLATAVLEKPWNDEILLGFLMIAYEDRLAGNPIEPQTRLTDSRTQDPGQRQNCWEFMACGREPGGNKVGELGICKATIGIQNQGVNGGTASGRFCWTVAGTLCDGEVQGDFAKRFPSCLKCPFYQKVHNLKKLSEPCPGN